jgi:hypothetical protein
LNAALFVIVSVVFVVGLAIVIVNVAERRGW